MFQLNVYQFNKVINDFLHFGMLEVAIMKLKEHLYPGNEALMRSDPINYNNYTLVS